MFLRLATHIIERIPSFKGRGSNHLFSEKIFSGTSSVVFNYDVVECPLPKQHEKLYEFFINGMYSDVRVRSKEKTFACHRSILASMSLYFDVIFNGSSKNNSSEDVVINDDIDATSLEEILQYFYNGSLPSIDASTFCRTTATVLARAMANEGFKISKGANLVENRRGLKVFGSSAVKAPCFGDNHRQDMAIVQKRFYLKSSHPISIPRVMEDKTFQHVFRRRKILLEFLNDMLYNNDDLKDQGLNIELLTDVSIPDSQGPPRYTLQQSNIFYDVLATDVKGNSYLIEMERSCEYYDIVRFQYYVARAFTTALDLRYAQLYKEKGENVPSNQELYKPENVPTVIAIIITEKGLPVKQFEKNFEEDGKYSIAFTHTGFGNYSKMNFLYIDLKKFSQKSFQRNSAKNMDFWCHFFWNTKDGVFNPELLKVYDGHPGLQETMALLLKMPSKEINEYHSKMSEKATLMEDGRIEGRKEVARKLLLSGQNFSNELLSNLTGLEPSDIEEIRREVDLPK